jgi:hypothetical protein
MCQFNKLVVFVPLKYSCQFDKGTVNIRLALNLKYILH